MVDPELAHLIKMANQIASNVGALGKEEAAAQAVATHLGKFWAPSMQQKLAAYLAADGKDLLPAVVDALGMLEIDVDE